MSNIESLLSEHWHKLMELRAEHLEYMLNTKPAERDKLEHAIAKLYTLMDLEPPRQIIWFDSPIDLYLALGMWTWMVDPYVHGSSVASRGGAESSFFAGVHDFLRKGDQELQARFPTLYSSSEDPRPILTMDFQFFFDSEHDPDESHRDLTMVLKTSARLVSEDPVIIRQFDGTGRIKSLLSLMKDPQGTINANVKSALEDNFNEREPVVERDMFGPATGMRLMEAPFQAIRAQINEILASDSTDRLIDVHTRTKNLLKFKRADWDRVGERFSNLSDEISSEIRDCFTWKVRHNFAHSYVRSPIHDSFRVATYRALDFMGVRPFGKMYPLMDALLAGGWWVGLSDICFACDNPSELHVDAQMRVHNESGMAMRFRDGWGFWAVSGTPLPEKVVLRQHSASDIDAVSYDRFITREMMIRRFGLFRYLKEGRVQEIHSDDYGTLYHATDPDGKAAGIIVTEQTSNTDFEAHAILVPETIRTAKDAVAHVAAKPKW